jgi:hypothetical protein
MVISMHWLLYQMGTAPMVVLEYEDLFDAGIGLDALH